MSPGDVIDQLLLNEDYRTRTDSMLFFGNMVAAVKGDVDLSHMPLAPAEVAKIRDQLQSLQIITREIANALDAAEQLHPAHFRPVEKGGR